VGEHRDFEFGVQVDNLSLKRAWSRHVNRFKFLIFLKYLLTLPELAPSWI